MKVLLVKFAIIYKISLRVTLPGHTVYCTYYEYHTFERINIQSISAISLHPKIETLLTDNDTEAEGDEYSC